MYASSNRGYTKTQIMLTYLYNKYLKKDTEKTYVNSITFVLDQSDNIKVYFNFDDPSLDSPIKIGNFLYYLSNGYYTNHILDILMKIAQKQPDHKEYIWNVINAWSLNIPDDTIENTDEQPIVKPSLFQNKRP